MKIMAGLLVLGCCMSVVYAEEAEFDEQFLYQHTGQGVVNLERFRYGNPISAGDYLADVYVNDEFRGQTLLTFIEVPKDPMQGLCWSSKLLEVLDIKPEAVAQTPDDSQCLSATTALPQLSLNFDVTNHRLDVSVPQALMVIYPRGYIPRSRWQLGVPATFLRYQFSGYHQDSDTTNANGQFLGLQFGVNAGMWSLRHQGSMSWSGGQKRSYSTHEMFVQRDIDRANGRLKLGDFYTQSSLLDNIAIRGISLASDARMLPYSQTGFAPEIRGVAKSNARVRVLQNNNIIYESTVGAGPFVISDLYAFSSGLGDLQVEVLEADGSKNTFTVPFFGATNMLRPKQLRYHLAAGYYRSQDTVGNSPLLHTSLHYGINNHLTVQTGAIINKDYQSATLGTIWGSRFGAITADFETTHANTHLNNLHAHNLRLGYSRSFDSTKTYLSGDIQHFFSKHNVGLSTVLLPTAQSAIQIQPLKNQYRLSLSQQLKGGLGAVYVSGILNDYHTTKNDYSYQMGYSNSYKQMQYRLGLNRSYSTNRNRSENTFYINVTIPFFEFSQDKRNNWSSVSTNYSHTPQGESSSLSFGKTFGELNQYDYTISANKQAGSQPSITGGLNANLSAAKIGLLATKQNQYKQYSYSASGAIIAYKHGIILNNDVSDTFAIIRAKGAVGTPILNGSGSKIDRWGNAVASTLSAYQVNHVAIDAQRLPDDIEISATGKEFVPRANTTNLVEFETQSGQTVLFDIENQDGALPALTTAAYDEQNNVVGYVVQGGRLFARLNQPKGKIKLNWYDNGDKQCVFDYELDNKDGQALQIYTVRCL